MSANSPRNVPTIMCLTENDADEWTGSTVQVPDGTSVAFTAWVSVAISTPIGRSGPRSGCVLNQCIMETGPRSGWILETRDMNPENCPIELPIVGSPSVRSDAARNRMLVLAAAQRLFAPYRVTRTMGDATAGQA